MYRPTSLTPCKQRVYHRSPIKTRSRSRTVNSDILIQYILTQMSMKQGIQRYRDKAKHSIMSELQQLHDLRSFESKDSMSLRTGSIYSNSSKQKLNIQSSTETKLNWNKVQLKQSSTETEVSAINDLLPQILWMKNFLDEQCNTSAIRLKVNKKASNKKK